MFHQWTIAMSFGGAYDYNDSNNVSIGGTVKNHHQNLILAYASQNMAANHSLEDEISLTRRAETLYEYNPKCFGLFARLAIFFLQKRRACQVDKLSKLRLPVMLFFNQRLPDHIYSLYPGQIVSG